MISHARSIIEDAKAKSSTDDPFAPPPLPDFGRWGEVRREALGGVRRATAENVSRSWRQVVHVFQEDMADARALEDLAAKEGDDAPTITAMLIKILAVATRRFEALGASYDPEAQELVLKDYVHVGCAVDTERGLYMPVIRDADDKPLDVLAAELAALAQRARDGGLGKDEMEGANISITNLGGLGTTRFAPIVPWPQVAILGVGRSRIEAHWNPDEKRFEPRPTIPLSLSYDHRAVDGADAARFLRWIAESIANPLHLTMSGG